MRRWIIIADATHCRVFSLTPARTLELVHHLDHPASREQSHELGSDQPGRLRKGMGRSARSSMEPRTDPHTVEIQQFAGEVATWLKSANTRHAFDEMALVAPPKFLGLIRPQLDAGTTARVTTSIAMDCAKISQEDLPEQLGGELAGWFGTLHRQARQ